MRYVQPDYMAEFACIAGACRHSCCIGWEIDVDEDTLARYLDTPGEWGARLREGIDPQAGCFRLTPDERCPFLNADGLCEIILHDGEDALCGICAEHPRFYQELAGCEEAGLGLCCEEAARLILTREAPVRLCCWGDDPDEPDPAEVALAALRDELTGLAQDRTQGILQRVDDIHRRCGIPIESTAPGRWADTLRGLERLEPAWTQLLDSLDDAPHGVHPPALERPLEQLLVYLLYRHVPQAAGDGDVQGHVALALMLWRLVRRLGLAGLDALLEAARLCSAEIEYSDVNGDALREAWHVTV